MQRQPVQSRAIAAIGYSRQLRTLEVEFHRGGTYRYLQVPPSVHQQLMAAESKARFYNRKVRGKYRALRVKRSQQKERRR
ncbi:MAG: KTSC domain-containing protein [Chthoniobacterales bacterium]|nr:KTSC domain-containing protein [Chthoniobacterales bacterium]